MSDDNLECTPECNMKCNMGIDNDDAIILEQFSSLLTSLNNIKTSITDIQQQVRIVEKNINKRHKKIVKESVKKKKKSNRVSGFAMPAKISEELSTFMNKNKGELVARTEVTRYIISYVKENNLQNKDNGQVILPDDKLKKLLDVKESDTLTYFNIQKFMNRHFHKIKK